MQSRIDPTPIAASIVMLLLAVFGSWPYGFYQLLRLVVCGTAMYVAIRVSPNGPSGWTWPMAGVAVVFNPIWVVHLSRTEWQAIDAVTAAVFAGALFAFRGRKPSNGLASHLPRQPR